ncbi:MAG: hypothetical protein R3B96_10655 [Pirellulaceae bacterium]
MSVRRFGRWYELLLPVLLIALVSCLGHRAAVGQESLDDRIPSDYLVAGVFDGRTADAEDIADREREIWEVLGPMYSELSLAIPVLNWNDMPVELRDAWIEEDIGAAFLESQIVFYNRLEGDPAMSAVPGMGVMISEGRFASFVDRFVRMVAADGGVGLERLRIDGAKIQRTVFRRELSLTFGTMDGYYVVTLGGPDELEWWLEQQEKGRARVLDLGSATRRHGTPLAQFERGSRATQIDVRGDGATTGSRTVGGHRRRLRSLGRAASRLR